MPLRIGLISTVVGVACCLWGCSHSGPELVEVHGTVTMDGEPLPKAHVIFRRADFTGRPSFGGTDENGFYRLGYSTARDGVLLGDFTVSISTYSEPYMDEETFERVPGAPETVPMRYNAKTELTATVEEEGQEINFDLTSDGEIFEY